jgi:hypothetical protein
MTRNTIARLVGASLVVAATAAPALAQGGGSFDGTWFLRRSFTTNEKGPGCGPIGMDFRVRIKGGVVFAPGGRGSVSPSGQIRSPGTGNDFRGTLRGNSASGTYTRHCQGTFTGRRS